MTPPEHHVFEIDGIRTLPLCSMVAHTLEEIPALGIGSGKAQIVYREPKLDPSPFGDDHHTVWLVSRDWEYAQQAVRSWQKYSNDLVYFLQFRNDTTGVLTRSLYHHVALLSILCDLRLSLDPTPFDRTLQAIISFGIVQGEYRRDPKRDDKYDDYAQKLENVYKDLCDHRENAKNLVSRMLRIMTTKRADWPMLPRIGEAAPNDPVESAKVKVEAPRKETKPVTKTHVFLSYCRDNQNEVMKLREELMEVGEPVWWDQDILPGQDWKHAIRQAMRTAYAVVLCFSEETANRTSSGIYPEVLNAIVAYREYAPGSIFLIPVRLSECAIPMIEIDATRTLDRLQFVDLFPPKQRTTGFQKVVDALHAVPHHP